MYNEAFLSSRVTTAKPSATKAMTQKAKTMKAQGRDVITLSQGELDFDTPAPIIAATYEALQRGETRYTEVPGTLALRAAVQEKFQRENNLSYTLDEIQVASGAKQILFNVFQATLNEGDEVIIPTPSWPSYPEMVLLASGTPVLLPCDEQAGYKLTAAQLEAAITPNTKWLLLNSPNNPTGAVLGADELAALGDVLLRHPHVWIISDEIYEHIRYSDNAFASIAAVVPALKERTLTINGLSKAWAMTGWRVGYCAGPAPLIKALNLIQSQSTSHASSVSQAAALAALQQPHDFIEQCRTALRERRDYVVNRISEMPLLSCDSPEGAFYIFVNCQAMLGKLTPQGTTLDSDEAIALYFLEHAEVAMVQGSAFGLAGYLRMSYACDLSSLQTALNRIQQACAELN